MMDGDYILLHFDHPHDHPYYLRGHVTKERAQEVLEYEEVSGLSDGPHC